MLRLGGVGAAYVLGGVGAASVPPGIVEASSLGFGVIGVGVGVGGVVDGSWFRVPRLELLVVALEHVRPAHQKSQVGVPLLRGDVGAEWVNSGCPALARPACRSPWP